MKILVVGDPHGDVKKLQEVPKKGIDFILITGDLGRADFARKRFFENVERKKKGLPELEKDKNFVRNVWTEIHNSSLDVLKYLSKIAPVYTLQGNVGVIYDSDVKKFKKKWGLNLPSTIKEVKKLKNVSFEKNRLRVVDGLRVGFLEYYIDTSWIKEFKPNDYSRKLKSAKKETDKSRKILNSFGKSGLDIFVCHQPPYGYLDKVGGAAPKHWHGKHAGGKAILDYIKKYQPKYVFCGHIHEGEGKAKIGKTEVYNLGVGGWKVIEM